MPHTLKITPLAAGPGIQFLLDGHDIANQLTGYSLRHDGIQPPVVQVELIPHEFEALLKGVAVELDPRLAEILTKLGWTPPGIAARTEAAAG